MKGLLREELPWLSVLTLLCLLLYIPCLGNRDLWGSVEPQYAEVAREALADGHWLVPYYNGAVYTIKPPLYPWLIALVSVPAGDVTEFTARLPSALSALGMVLIVYLLGKDIFSRRVGLLAALILASSPNIYKSACMVRIDMPLALFTTASLAAFYVAFSHSKNNYYLLGWFFAALTVLTKGPLGPLIIALTISLYLYSTKKHTTFIEEHGIVLGACIFVATIMAWLVPAYMQEGKDYLYHMLGWVREYATGRISKEGIFYYMQILFGVGFGPAALLIPVAIYSFYKNNVEGLRLPLIWFVVVLLVLTIIPGKHSRYLLLLYPAIALLAAVPVDSYLAKSVPMSTWPAIRTFPVLLLGAIVGLEITLMESHQLPYPNVSLALSAVFLVTGMYFALRASQFHLIFGTIFLMLIVFGVSRYQFFLPKENEKNSEKALCRNIVNSMEPGATWAVYKNFRPSYPFYTKTYPRIFHKKEDALGFLSLKERVYCLIPSEHFNELSAFVTVVARLEGKGGTELILASNRPGDG